MRIERTEYYFRACHIYITMGKCLLIFAHLTLVFFFRPVIIVGSCVYVGLVENQIRLSMKLIAHENVGECFPNLFCFW